MVEKITQNYKDEAKNTSSLGLYGLLFGSDQEAFTVPKESVEVRRPNLA